MLLVATAIALALQLPDTVGPAYDSQETRELVERAVVASRDVPEGLQDYEADVRTSMFIALAPDSISGSDLPAGVDELVSRVRWHRSDYLHQEVLGHRTRLLVPLPYTLATLVERPWVVPHLYGNDIYTPFAGPRAVNPFGSRGPEHYRYTALDPVRIRVQNETVTLVPISVRPRVSSGERGPLLVVGTFYLDMTRAAVARARFGFVGRSSDLPSSLGRMETLVELENALWQGSYWLPFRQRRDVVFESKVLGGAVTARVVSRFQDYDFNTGWTPEGRRIQLAWNLRDSRGAFGDWRGEIGENAGEYSLQDFADLRVATAASASGAEGGARLQLHYERGSHLFRFNRVEGPFLGLGARLVPADPRRDRWQVYGTAGWAFAEQTARGELGTSWGAAVAPDPLGGVDWGGTAAAYRRLPDIQPFRPTYAWDWIYTLPAVFWGSDLRDYYDAAGAEAFATVRSGRWDGRLGGRVERQDSVSVNTQRFLFGTAEEFGPLAGVEPGMHAAIEASGGYALGPGAFGIGNSAIVRLDGEVGVADFDYRRVTALLSARYALGPLTLATRVDGGHAWGGVPPQKLFRFGSIEGLRGYETNEFGGSTALLARGRFLLGLPPRSTRPLARFGAFLIPPLRPSLVLLGETGWTHVDASLADELQRLLARPTGGWRSSVGAGVSILEDAFTVEYMIPVGEGAEERDGRWYVGLTYWY